MREMHKRPDERARQEDCLEEMMSEQVFIKLSVVLSGVCVSGGKTCMCNKSALGDNEQKSTGEQMDGDGWEQKRDREEAKEDVGSIWCEALCDVVKIDL